MKDVRGVWAVEGEMPFPVQTSPAQLYKKRPSLPAACHSNYRLRGILKSQPTKFEHFVTVTGLAKAFHKFYYGEAVNTNDNTNGRNMLVARTTFSQWVWKYRPWGEPWKNLRPLASESINTPPVRSSPR